MVVCMISNFAFAAQKRPEIHHSTPAYPSICTLYRKMKIVQAFFAKSQSCWSVMDEFLIGSCMI